MESWLESGTVCERLGQLSHSRPWLKQVSPDPRNYGKEVG